MTFSLRTDRRLIRAEASSTRYLLVSFLAPEAPAPADRRPVNVALVLDRSGSMSGARKFDLAREAVEQALAMLRPEDRFTVVVYDEEVDVLTPSRSATPDAKRRALDSLRDVGPRGATNLCAGWMRGCEQIAEYLRDDAVARALLLTDGLANRGTTNRTTLARHAAELRERGIATSTFGVGADFDERLLRDLAHEGGGNFYFLETPAQIPDLLTSELGEALEVVVRRAALQLVLPSDADAAPLNHFRYTRAHGDNELRVELGDLVSGQEASALIRIQFAPGRVGDTAAVRVELTGDGTLAPIAEGGMTWTYASHRENDVQPRDREVDREVARLYAALARAEATEANRHRDFSRARHVLERTASRIRSYAGSDPELHALLAELDHQVPTFERAMSPMALKAHFASAEWSARTRRPDGKARRPRGS